MSAGDVLFVGWTGSNPLYKELEPTFDYEPYREQKAPSGTGIFGQSVAVDKYIRIKMTRRFICFNKDKSNFISSIGFDNVSNSLVYIDTDGSVKTKSVGAGWTLKTINESELAPGYSNINVTYEKIEHKGLAFPVSGLSFICDSGVCKINYNGTDIETIDSGTSECTTGLTASVEIVNTINSTILDITTNPEEFQDTVCYKLSLLCNNVEADYIEIKGSDLALYDVSLPFLNIVNEKTGSQLTSEQRTNFYNLAPLTTEQKNNFLQIYQSNYPDTEYVKYKFEFTKNIDEKFSGVAEFFETQNNSSYTISFDTERVWDIKLTEYIKTTAVFKIPRTEAPSFAFQKEGNVIKLVASGGGLKEKIIWREWDVTGL